jgi:hypothetical protein
VRQRQARPHLELKTRPRFCPVNLLLNQNQHMTKQIEIQMQDEDSFSEEKKCIFLIEDKLFKTKIKYRVRRFDIFSDLYYKHITIVNDDSSTVNIKLQFGVLHTDIARVVIYNCNMFIKQTTGLKNWLE